MFGKLPLQFRINVPKDLRLLNNDLCHSVSLRLLFPDSLILQKSRPSGRLENYSSRYPPTWYPEEPKGHFRDQIFAISTISRF